MVCACAVGLRGNRLTGTRGTWGVVWRSAHVPTIPFTWLRRANAWTPTAHASNYQALLSIKLCKQCGFNSCVRVFFIPWGHVSNHAHIWAFVTSISHMGQMRDSDWSREILLRSDWLQPSVALCTTRRLLPRRPHKLLSHLSIAPSQKSWKSKNQFSNTARLQRNLDFYPKKLSFSRKSRNTFCSVWLAQFVKR